MAEPQGGLYPPIEPYDQGYLDVGDGHSLYWELVGRPGGTPAVFLHGGPGGGCSPNHRRLFDPARYSVLLFDQRGCGRSRPHACLEANTTGHLLADLERLRQRCFGAPWLMVGGSWGSTLALAYAEAHPAQMRALVLRGVLTARRAELSWFYGHGANQLFPDAWERFLALLPEAERHDPVPAYYRLLTAPDRAVRIVAAKAWSAWELGLLTLRPPQDDARFIDDDSALALARIGAHYVVHDCFLEEGRILREAGRLRGLPGTIVQGRYDLVTPVRTAWDLHRAWPEAALRLVPDAGHASFELGITRELISALDAFAGARAVAGGV